MVDNRSVTHTRDVAAALRDLPAGRRADSCAGWAGLWEPTDSALSGRVHALHGDGKERGAQTARPGYG